MEYGTVAFARYPCTSAAHSFNRLHNLFHRIHIDRVSVCVCMTHITTKTEKSLVRNHLFKANVIACPGQWVTRQPELCAGLGILEIENEIQFR